MDKETNFKETCIDTNYDLINQLVRNYFLENWGLPWGVCELESFRQEAQNSFRNKNRVLLEILTSQEDFPFKWIIIEGKETLVFKHQK